MQEENNFFSSSSEDSNGRNMNTISSGQPPQPFSSMPIPGLQLNSQQLQTGIGQSTAIPSCPVPQIPVYPPRFYYYTAAQGFPRSSFEPNNIYPGYFGNEGIEINYLLA